MGKNASQDPAETPGERAVAKKRWHQANARLPLREKVRQLLALQEQDLPLIARHRPLKWYERPWPVEP